MLLLLPPAPVPASQRQLLKTLLWLLLALPTLALAQQPLPGQVPGVPGEAKPTIYAGLYSDPAAAQARPDRRLVRYDLTVRDTTWVIGGIRNHALATNGGVPAPTLTFTEGDTALIYVRNSTSRTVSFHWHGLLLPNRYDGVPILTTALIEPGEVHTYKFPIAQHGTYWYHSHTRLNEQLGQYGAIVIYPPTPLATPDRVVLLSDWTREKPWEILRSLKRETDWYAIERGSVQSYGKAIRQGYLGTKLRQEWSRMPDMDLADVYYQADLINGQPGQQAPEVQPGRPVRLRLINGSAASYFWVQLGGAKLRVVAADGVDVVPVEVDKLLIATAETYDVEVTLPGPGQYELRATSWDITRHVSLLLGTGQFHPAPDLPQIDYFALVKSMNGMMGQMPGMKMGRSPGDVPPPSVVPPGSAPPPPGPGMDMGQMSKDPSGMAGMDMGQPNQQAGSQSRMNTGQKSKSPDDMGGMDGMDMGQKAKSPGNMAGLEMPKKPAPAQPMPGMAMPGMTSKAPAADSSQAPMSGLDMGKSSMDASQMAGMKMPMGSLNSMGGMQMAPLGTYNTGAKQLQAAFPTETLLDYTMLRAPRPTTLPADRPVRTIHLYLTGNMRRYVWSINNVPLSLADKIQVKRGQTVRFVLHNTTMMSHPMHLHGHFFRVINGQGDYAPLKHTLSVAPMDLVTIEFDANEYKDWFFHCHLLYHLNSGMARIVHYEGDTVRTDNPALLSRFIGQDRALFPYAVAQVQSQGTWLDGGIRNSYWLLRAEAQFDWHGDYESEAHVQRYLGARQFLAVYAGFDLRNNSRYLNPGADKRDENGHLPDTKDYRRVACVGLRYFLPMMVWGDVRYDSGGKLRVQLERESLPITRHLRADLMVNSDREYRTGLAYIVGKYVAVSGNYDSDYGWGAGIRIIY